MPKAKLKSINGARVKFCAHDGWFPADIYVIEGAAVVRAVGKITPDNLHRPATDATHHVVDWPNPTFWRPELGVLVVPVAQCKVL